MGAALTFRVLLILTLAVMAECSRPLQSSHRSSLLMSMLQTPPKPLQPPPLSPIQRQHMYEARKPPSPNAEDLFHLRGYRYGSPMIHGSFTATTSSSSTTATTSPSMDLNQGQYSGPGGANGNRPWGFQLLHKNPAGPNPIGNEFRPGNSKTAAKKNRYPPPYGG